MQHSVVGGCLATSAKSQLFKRRPFLAFFARVTLRIARGQASWLNILPISIAAVHPAQTAYIPLLVWANEQWGVLSGPCKPGVCSDKEGSAVDPCERVTLNRCALTAGHGDSWRL